MQAKKNLKDVYEIKIQKTRGRDRKEILKELIKEKERRDTYAR